MSHYCGLSAERHQPLTVRRLYGGRAVASTLWRMRSERAAVLEITSATGMHSLCLTLSLDPFLFMALGCFFIFLRATKDTPRFGGMPIGSVPKYLSFRDLRCFGSFQVRLFPGDGPRSVQKMTPRLRPRTPSTLCLRVPRTTNVRRTRRSRLSAFGRLAVSSLRRAPRLCAGVRGRPTI